MSPRISAVLVCLGVLWAAITSTGCDVKVGEQGLSFDVAHGRASDEWSRTYTVSTGGRFEIVSVNGPIEVFPSTGTQIEVRAKREVRTRSDEAAQELLKKLQINEEVSADRVKVEAQRLSDEDIRSFGRPRITVEYRVNVPAGLSVSVTTQNGDVRLENVEGTMVAGSTNGSIRTRGFAGAIDATTVNGVIQLEIARLGGEVKATTVNGPVRVDLPPDVNATLDATTVNGGVRLDDGLRFTASQRERLRVAGRLGSGGPNIILRATNGPVTVGVTAAPPNERRPQRPAPPDSR